MKLQGIILALILALVPFVAQSGTSSRSAASAGYTPAPIVYRESCIWVDGVLFAVTFPFRLVGNGIYYTVQSPRMLIEWITFGNIGESFAEPPKDLPRWRRMPWNWNRPTEVQPDYPGRPRAKTPPIRPALSTPTGARDSA